MGCVIRLLAFETSFSYGFHGVPLNRWPIPIGTMDGRCCQADREVTAQGLGMPWYGNRGRLGSEIDMWQQQLPERLVMHSYQSIPGIKFQQRHLALHQTPLVQLPDFNACFRPR